MSDDLTAFLNARLDEDEWEAKAIKDVAAGKRTHYRAAVTARADRDLREVAFKRAILAMHAPVPFWGNNPPPLRDRTPENAVSSYCECQCPDGEIEDMYPCDTARLLAAVYSGHPDYRDEWKP